MVENEVYCDRCGEECTGEHWVTGTVVECDTCFSEHFNAAI